MRVQLASLVAVFGAASAHGAVLNFSFENPSVALYDYTVQSQSPTAGPYSTTVANADNTFSTVSTPAIESWGIDQLTGPVGAVGVQVVGNAPDGTQTGFTNGAHAIYQHVGSLDASTTYTLSVSVGNGITRLLNGTTLDTPVPGTIELVNGTDATGTVLASLPVLASPGTFTTYTLPAFTAPANASGELTIVLRNDLAEGAVYSTTQVNFDKVSLSSVAVPEPTTAAAFAGLGLIFTRRRRGR